MRTTEIELPQSWSYRALQDLLSEVEVQVIDLPSDERGGLEVLSLTKRFGLIPQSDRFEKRVATENVDKYKVVRKDWIVYNPYVIWEGAIHALRRDAPGIVSPVYPVWQRTESDGGFLDFALRTPELIAVYEKLSAGAVNRRRSIKKEDFLEIELPMPPILEQQKIAAALRLIQGAINMQGDLLALLSETREALISDLLLRGCGREPQKTTAIGPTPSSWNVTRFDKLCVLQRGFDITKKHQAHGTVPVVSSGGVASYHNVAMVKGPGVVIGRKGSLGTVHYIETDFWPHDTTLWVKDFKGNDPLFVSYFLENLHLEKYDSGGTNPTLNRNTVHAQIVAYPRAEEQSEIARMVKCVDDAILIHERKLSILNKLFRHATHQLLMGQIAVHDLDMAQFETKVLA